MPTSTTTAFVRPKVIVIQGYGSLALRTTAESVAAELKVPLLTLDDLNPVPVATPQGYAPVIGAKEEMTTLLRLAARVAIGGGTLTHHVDGTRPYGRTTIPRTAEVPEWYLDHDEGVDVSAIVVEAPTDGILDDMTSIMRELSSDEGRDMFLPVWVNTIDQPAEERLTGTPSLRVAAAEAWREIHNPNPDPMAGLTHTRWSFRMAEGIPQDFAHKLPPAPDHSRLEGSGGGGEVPSRPKRKRFQFSADDWHWIR